MIIMNRNTLPLVVAFAAFVSSAHAQAPASPVKATPLMTKDLPGIAGKEATALTVELAPGAVSPPHRHEASTFVYVLEGSIVMGVKGGKEVTLGPGEMFHEKPDDIHTVGRNASATKPAKFLVFMVKAKGAPVSLPVHEAH
jgi:quercetin dioxygenase-like cupin family protein